MTLQSKGKLSMNSALKLNQNALVPVKKQVPAKRSSGDPWQNYLRQVRSTPLLTQEEEHEYATKWHENGDPLARDRLIGSHLRLVVKVAHTFQRQWTNLLDLVQEGNVGLIEAIHRYDPYRSVRFSTYARYWIRAMILRFLLDNWSLIRVGGSRAGRRMFFQLQKERQELSSRGIDPSTAQIAERTGIPEEEIALIASHLDRQILNLDAPVGNEGRSLSETVSEPSRPSPESHAARSEIGALLQGHLQRFGKDLEGRELEIWQRRLMTEDPEPLSALGEDFGVSKQRVGQMEKSLKERLRGSLVRAFGDDLIVDL